MDEDIDRKRRGRKAKAPLAAFEEIQMDDINWNGEVETGQK